MGPLVDRHEQKRRMERERGDGVGRQTMQTRRAPGGDHRHARRELAHHLALNQRVECHESTTLVPRTIDQSKRRGLPSPTAKFALYTIPMRRLTPRIFSKSRKARRRLAYSIHMAVQGRSGALSE